VLSLYHTNGQAAVTVLLPVHDRIADEALYIGKAARGRVATNLRWTKHNWDNRPYTHAVASYLPYAREPGALCRCMFPCAWPRRDHHG